MVIRTGDTEWTVEAVDSRSEASARDFVDVTFRRAGSDDHLELPWVPRPTELTVELARHLFTLAGFRHWRDPRTGTRWQVRLTSWEDGEGLAIRFSSDTDAGPEIWTVYPLVRPLGMASGIELEAMLDEAAGGVAGRVN